MFVWKANPVIIEKLADNGCLLPAGEIAAQLSALLAAQDADHLPRHDAVVHRHGHRGATAFLRARAARRRGTPSSSRPGAAPGWTR
jgi:hypothetical protein